MKLDIRGEDLIRVRKRRSPIRSGKLRKPRTPKSLKREVINDSFQLMEISSKLAQRYAGKAIEDKTKLGTDDDSKRKYMNRTKGINRAQAIMYKKDMAKDDKRRMSGFWKLKKESENVPMTKELNELSKKTLASYVKKAKQEKTSFKDGKGFTVIRHKRKKGISMAQKKLAKEETVETPKKKTIQEMIYKKEPISNELVGKIIEKITPEVIESLGPKAPPKGDASGGSSSLGPKKPKKDTSLRSKIQAKFAENN